LPAAALHYNERTATSDDDAVERTDILPGDLLGLATRGDEPAGAFHDSETVVDSKYDKLQELLRQIWEKEPEAKVLIFTFFVGTATYLRDRLTNEGIGALRIAGDVPSNPHEPEQDERGKRMRAFREDREMRVLVSTEVGSEGLDFQYCHHVVNYDLPWNPMVVEQRIGRIDRFGQESDAVYIHNLVVKDTVEERILLRLYDRIGIFKESIGDLESILGETISELQRDYVNGRLSPEDAERRVQDATNAILRRKQHLETLQQAAGDLFGHEEYIRDEMQRVGRLGRYISEQSLLALITSYLRVS
jgi:superfamily II DNA/RNA helicase